MHDSSNLLYIIDYGLAKKYRDPNTYIHIPYKENKRLAGTARYASLYTHLGIEQSRRDDMESLGYTFVYLLKGSLPWQGVKGENRLEKYTMIKEIKQKTKPETLCEGLPQIFVKYLRYCQQLKFEEKPDYAGFRNLFKTLFYERQYDNNFDYDWVFLEALSTMAPNDNINKTISETNIADCSDRRLIKKNDASVSSVSTPTYSQQIPKPFARFEKEELKEDHKEQSNKSIEMKNGESNEENKDIDRKQIEEGNVIEENNDQENISKKNNDKKIHEIYHSEINNLISSYEGNSKRLLVHQPIPIDSYSCNFQEDDIYENVPVLSTLVIKQ